MSEPYIGEIRIFGGNFAPVGWAFCDGSLLPISQFDALFALIGTTYGGDGQNTFQLPDLRGRTPIHMGSSFVIGEVTGSEQVTLTPAQLPGHTHAANGATLANAVSPAGRLWSTDPDANVAAYNTGSSSGASLNASAVGSAGGSIPHENMQPFLVINYIIALFGIFPSQS